MPNLAQCFFNFYTWRIYFWVHPLYNIIETITFYGTIAGPRLVQYRVRKAPEMAIVEIGKNENMWHVCTDYYTDSTVKK